MWDFLIINPASVAAQASPLVTLIPIAVDQAAFHGCVSTRWPHGSAYWRYSRLKTPRLCSYALPKGMVDRGLAR
jgi:hypothetical protein